MGVVYLARSPGGRAVAVKMIRQRFADDAEHRARFRRAVSAARAVTGAFTAAVLDAALDDGPPWVVTAYVPGLTLTRAGTLIGTPRVHHAGAGPRRTGRAGERRVPPRRGARLRGDRSARHIEAYLSVALPP
jgi:serine/threonine protein kinase